jgi:C-terminal processing protease CtpA/Prc
MSASLAQRLCALLLPLLLACPLGAHADGRGVFGFSMAIDSEGFFLNPTLRSIRITKVAPASPAEQAGLKVGDEVIEVAGRTVAGAKGREIQALAEKDVGQALQIKVRRAGGELTALTLVAVEKLASTP